jgi:hypothetical protein
MRIDRALVVGLLLCAGAARAADNLPPAIGGIGYAPAPAAPRIPRGDGGWQAALGFRTGLYRGAGYDPFSSNDVFTQLSLAATRAFGGEGDRVRPALGVVWETGQADDDARGVRAQLGLVRLAASLELRVAPWRGTYLFARLTPGILHAAVTLHDPSAPAPLRASYTSAAADGSAGAAVRFTPQSSPVGFWLLAEGGYGWAPPRDVVLAPDLPASDKDKAGTTTLGSLAPRGPFMRLALALSY